MLSQLRRKCKGNNAEYIRNIQPFTGRREALFRINWYLFLLTFTLRQVILEEIRILSQETFMSEEKLAILRQSHTLHPHPDRVRDPLFTSGSPFFDPRDQGLSQI